MGSVRQLSLDIYLSRLLMPLYEVLIEEIITLSYIKLLTTKINKKHEDEILAQKILPSPLKKTGPS
jgi:hypothetical protein